MDRIAWLSLSLIAYALLLVVDASGGSPALYAVGLPAMGLVGLADWATRLAKETPLEGARTRTRLATLFAIIAVFGLGARVWPVGSMLMAIGAGGLALTALVSVFSAPQATGLASVSPALGVPPAPVVVLGAAALGLLGLTAARAFDVSVPVPMDLDATLLAGFSFGATFAIGAGTLLELGRRRGELGPAHRHRAVLPVVLTCGAALGTSIALKLEEPSAIGLVGLLFSSLTANIAGVTEEPETLGRAGATLVMLGLLTVLPNVFLIGLAKRFPDYVAQIVAIGAAFSTLSAMASPSLAKRLLPLVEPWAETLHKAREESTRTDPKSAIQETLRRLFQLTKISASAMTVDPGQILRIDVAGNLQSKEGSVPERLFDLGRHEPHGVITHAALVRASVRKPEVRPLAQWLADIDSIALVTVDDEEGPIGLLSIAKGDRQGPLLLSEVRALSRLGRSLAGPLSAYAKAERARRREASLERARLQDRTIAAGLETELADLRRRKHGLAKALHHQAERNYFSPAARTAIDVVESAAMKAEPLVLVIAPGLSALPWLGAYQASSPRSDLVLLDGLDPRHRDLEVWRAKTTSPLEEARGAILAVDRPEELPKLVQAFIASNLEKADVKLLALVPKGVDVLVGVGKLDARLADALGTNFLVVPPLAARGEDLRALVLEHLTRLGLALRGEPIGIEPAALAMLLDYDWPVNEAELLTLLGRALLKVEGPTLGRRDLIGAGFRTP